MAPPTTRRAWGEESAVAEFSAADVALHGFRVVWGRPRSVLYWAALQLAFSLGVAVFVILSAGPAYTKLQAWTLQPTPDPTQVFGLFRELLPTYIALIAVSLVFYAVLSAAMNRAVLKPGDDAFGYLRLSNDELRQLGLLAALSGLGLLVFVGIFVASVMVASILGAVTSNAQAPETAIALLLLVMGSVLAFIFLGVRFSLAAPSTFARQRIDILGSWRLTSGHFWPLFGTYLIAAALSLVVLLLALAIAVIAAAIVSGGLGSLGDVSNPNLSTLATGMKPARVAYLAVLAIGTALSWPITMTPPAMIYRALTGDAGAVSRTFD
jgi:hypothetical protein